jgi:parvulin-like peptidyl-prolyl isomerase
VNSEKKILKIFIFFCLLSTLYCLLPFVSWAEVVDRIVAIVNDEVITLSELKERSRIEKRAEKEVLEAMINRVLLLSEAKRLGIAGLEEGDNLIIERFIERRIKAFILIPLERAKEFYEKNKEEFRGKEFSEVREEINLFLIEQETNKRLEEYLIELKKKADIRIP